MEEINVLLQLPEDIHSVLKILAKTKEQRSLNGQIRFLCQQYVEKKKHLVDAKEHSETKNNQQSVAFVKKTA